LDVGLGVGELVGLRVGESVGVPVGCAVVGLAVGLRVVGDAVVGVAVGLAVVGLRVGDLVGAKVGTIIFTPRSIAPPHVNWSHGLRGNCPLSFIKIRMRVGPVDENVGTVIGAVTTCGGVLCHVNIISVV
jgi:hypothetical protein